MVLRVIGSGSKGNCYLLEGETETLIIEAGIPFKEILKEIKYDTDRISGAIVSHEHGDHSKAIGHMIKHGIPVLSSEGTFQALGFWNNFGIVPVKPMERTVLGGFTILGFDVNHDAAQPFGYIIRHKECGDIVFITDSFYSEYKFGNINHWIIEANYDEQIMDQNMSEGKMKQFLKDRIISSHFSIQNCEEMMIANDLSKTRSIVLCHLSDTNADAEHFLSRLRKTTAKPVYIANKGTKINFS